MQPDAGIMPMLYSCRIPSIVLEAGSAESRIQLEVDARHWLEKMPEVSLIFPCCHLLKFSSDTASHPYIHRPYHSPPPKYS